MRYVNIVNINEKVIVRKYVCINVFNTNVVILVKVQRITKF